MTAPPAAAPPAAADRDELAGRIAADLAAFCVGKLRDQAAQVDRCVRLLAAEPGEQVWRRANGASNSVGVLVLHLTGNVGQWGAAGLRGEPFDRDRPAEFARRDPVPADALLAGLHAAVGDACDALAAMTPADFAAAREVQGYRVTGTAAAVHVTEHFTGHASQIVAYTKLFTGRDLSLYDDRGRRLAGPTGAGP